MEWLVRLLMNLGFLGTVGVVLCLAFGASEVSMAWGFIYRARMSGFSVFSTTFAQVLVEIGDSVLLCLFILLRDYACPSGALFFFPTPFSMLDSRKK